MRSTLAFITTILLCSTVAHAEETTFKVTPGKPNEVKFTSKAPLESVVGVTDKISGWIKMNPMDLSQPVSASFEVQMASLDTDNKVRNGHMRDNHLHTEQYPTSGFVLSKREGLPAGRMPAGEEVSFKAHGEFSLHGTARIIVPEVTAVWDDIGNALLVTANFDVMLPDYDIPRPRFLVMKLDERQRIEVTFTAIAE